MSRIIPHQFRTGVLALALVSLSPCTAMAEDPLVVQAVRAEQVETRQHLSLTGEISAREMVQTAFPTGGRIAEIAVEDGDRVKAGEVLARIEKVQQEQSLRAAEAQLAATRAEYDAAQDADRRQTALLERGATTRAARNAAADRFAAAVARRAQAEAELQQARDALEDTVIYAQNDATVIRKLAEPGQVVGAAQPVLELALGEGLDAVFNVPEQKMLGTTEAEEPTIILSPIDRPNVQVPGFVREISPLVDPATGTVQVTIGLEEPLPGLSYGDTVRGTSQPLEGRSIVLPWSTVTADDQGTAVWVIDPASGAVSLRGIEVKRYTSDSVLLESGVEEGELVVSKGAQLLYPGRIVVLQEDL